MKSCEMCGIATASKSRFCGKCRRIAVRMLKDVGYLGPAPRPGPNYFRSGDQKENTRETAFGTGH